MGTGSVTASSLNVRSGPGTSYSRIGSLTRGSVATVRSVSGDWAQIDYAGRTGYLHRLPGHQRQRRWFLRPYPLAGWRSSGKTGTVTRQRLAQRALRSWHLLQPHRLAQPGATLMPVLSVSLAGRRSPSAEDRLRQL